MTVLSLSSCPAKVRGYLTAWFLEIAVGVYVGDVSSRVREELWKIITENIGNGRAIMAYSANNEQGMAFATYNTGFTPVDFDGISLVRRPNLKTEKPSTYGKVLPDFYGLEHFQKKNAEAVKEKTGKGHQTSGNCKQAAEIKQIFIPQDYCVIDLETSGLNPASDSIIEFGALKIRNRTAVERFRCMVRTETVLGQVVVDLTGITNEMLEREGIPLPDALSDFFAFIGSDTIAGHNVGFDIAFLQQACATLSLPSFSPAFIDSWIMSKQVQPGLRSYRLSELLKYFGIADEQYHRALEDAELTYLLLEKLNEIRKT